MNDTKNKVDPAELEKWFINNPEKVYKRSVEAARSILENTESEKDVLFQFYWDDEIYATIYMAKKDIPKAMEKAIKYFVENEIYELAQEAKNLKDSLV